VAFDPLPGMISRARDNATLNQSEIEFHQCALSDAEGVMPFFVNTTGNPAMSTLHPESPAQFSERIDVAVTTARHLIDRAQAPAPSVAIIDAEGAEVEVLRGFGPRLAADGPSIIVFEAPNDFGAAGGALHDLLAAAGYRFRRLERRENTAHALSNFVAERAN
jgi:FkbM family methyltransferase